MRGATRHDRHVRYVPWVGAVLDGLLAVLAPAVAVLDVALGSVRHTVNNHYNGITEKRRVEKKRYMGRAGEFYYFIVQVLLNSSPSHNTSHICLTTPRQLAHTQSNPGQQVTPLGPTHTGILATNTAPASFSYNVFLLLVQHFGIPDTPDLWRTCLSPSRRKGKALAEGFAIFPSCQLGRRTRPCHQCLHTRTCCMSRLPLVMNNNLGKHTELR
jgi:hypothetical protein